METLDHHPLLLRLLHLFLQSQVKLESLDTVRHQMDRDRILEKYKNMALTTNFWLTSILLISKTSV
jgi:hypothetical protein